MRTTKGPLVCARRHQAFPQHYRGGATTLVHKGRNGRTEDTCQRPPSW